MKLKKEDNRIIIINHKKNYGTYYSRTEGALNSRGKYILFVDPDDLIINPYLFEALYYYYNNFNLDIIEFTVYHQIEEKNLIYYPQEHKHNHYHNFQIKLNINRIYPILYFINLKQKIIQLLFVELYGINYIKEK